MAGSSKNQGCKLFLDYAARERAWELKELGIETLPVKPNSKAPKWGPNGVQDTYALEDFGSHDNIGIHHVPAGRLATIDRDCLVHDQATSWGMDRCS